MTLKNGLLGGFVGSAVLAAIFVLKSMMGIMPEMDIIVMLSAMMGAPVIAGWAAHFMIGTIAWGGIFAVANDLIPGRTQIVKGIVVGLAAWLMMMVAVLPMAGAGFFGINFGIMGAVLPLMLHIIFGAVMGYVYSAMGQSSAQTA
ncbi:DUF6789 family protein [Maritalea sp.]|jgi:hypothetical protein|uniref:DUF6789 family protein n=1 Tax=Maritalea sp. TaxID=2003361 RepID=UPI0039E51C27